MNRNRWGVIILFRLLLSGHDLVSLMIVKAIAKLRVKVEFISESSGGGQEQAIEYSRVGADESWRHVGDVLTRSRSGLK